MVEELEVWSLALFRVASSSVLQPASAVEGEETEEAAEPECVALYSPNCREVSLFRLLWITASLQRGQPSGPRN